MTNAEGTERVAEFSDSPADQHRRWMMELDAAKQARRDWDRWAEVALKAYQVDRDAGQSNATFWPLFAASVDTMEASLFGNTPKSDVARRFADSSDDVARVAGEILERHINTDIERADDGYCSALRLANKDSLIVGGAFAWLRYVREAEPTPATPAIQDEETGEEKAPAVPAGERVVFEDVETDYVHWRDVLWSAGSRHLGEVRWFARRALMPREALVKRFGKQMGNAIPVTTKKREGDETPDPWARAEVWEIWSKEDRKVYHVCEAHPVCLDVKADPYGLDGFWPMPEPIFTNTTSERYLPKPDYTKAMDLYDEANQLSTRIRALSKALKVAGVYDKSNEGLQALLSEGMENRLIPVNNFAALSEKGGIAGAIQWMPVEEVAKTLLQLRDYRRDVIDMLDQVTGKSDVERGQIQDSAETATATRIKAKSSSVRIDKRKKELARFATDAQRIRGEIICKLFAPETILSRANVQHMPEGDRALATQAIQLLKDRFSEYRIEVKPESIAYTDFDAQKSEAMEVMGGVAQFVSAFTPLVQAEPAIKPFALEMLQAFLARLKGGAVFESIIDRAIQAAQQAAANPQAAPPDPKVQAATIQAQTQQQKLQGEMVKDAQKHSQKMTEIQAEANADLMREEAQSKYGTQEAIVKHTLQEQSRAAAAREQASKPKPPKGASR